MCAISVNVLFSVVLHEAVPVDFPTTRRIEAGAEKGGAAYRSKEGVRRGKFVRSRVFFDSLWLLFWLWFSFTVRIR